MNGNKMREKKGAGGSDQTTLQEANYSNINRDINRNERGRKNLSN